MKTKLRFFKDVDKKVSHIFAAVIAALVLVVSSDAYGQKGSYDEVGLFLGAGYYNGEINPSAPFYKPQLAFGLNLRHVLNNRMAITFQASKCTLKGDDADFSDVYRRTRKAKFENEVTELGLNFEYNFLPLERNDPYKRVSPFVAAGMAACVASFPQEGLRAAIPFGAGVKFIPSPKWTISVEWKYRKLFSDLLDHIGEDTYSSELGGASKQKSFLGNDDWYAFFGVVVSYCMNGNGGSGNSCPAYQK